MSDGSSFCLISNDTARILLKESIAVFVFIKLKALLIHEVFYFKNRLSCFFHY